MLKIIPLPAAILIAASIHMASTPCQRQAPAEDTSYMVEVVVLEDAPRELPNRAQAAAARLFDGHHTWLRVPLADAPVDGLRVVGVSSDRPNLGRPWLEDPAGASILLRLDGPGLPQGVIKARWQGVDEQGRPVAQTLEISGVADAPVAHELPHWWAERGKATQP